MADQIKVVDVSEIETTIQPMLNQGYTIKSQSPVEGSAGKLVFVLSPPPVNYTANNPSTEEI